MKDMDYSKVMRSGMGRREFLSMAAKMGLVVVGSSMIPTQSWGAKLGYKQTTKFKVPWEVPRGLKFPKGATLGYFSWEPWCRPYQMDIFTSHTGVKFETAIFKSTKEMLTKLGAGAARNYDVFSPSQYSPRQCVEAGWFQAVNLDNVPHYKNLHSRFQHDPFVHIDGKDYVIPFVWGTDAVITNTEKVAAVDSLSLLFDPNLKGRLTMQDSAVNSMAAVAILLGFKNPFRLGEEELQKVKEAFVKIKPQIRAFWTSDSQANTLLTSGEVWVCFTARLAQVVPLRDAGLKVAWNWPKEGSYGWFEGIAVSSFTKYKEAAEVFADWCIGEEFGAILAKDIGYYPCSTACTGNLSQEEISRVYLDDPEVPTKTFMMEMPKNIDRWQEVWSEIKAL